MRWRAGVLALAVLAACGGGNQSSPSTTSAARLDGAMLIKLDPILGSVLIPDTPDCSGAATAADRTGRTFTFFSASVKDLVAGAPVQVTDEAGKTVGVGTLAVGTWDRSLPGCRMPFSVQVSPAKFYRVHVGRQPEQTFPAGAPATFTLQG